MTTRTLHSALYLRDMPASGQSSVINGASFPVPPGLSPIVYTDRGDADLGQPGTWLASPGYAGVDLGLFERWAMRQPVTGPPILLDVEVQGNDWWLVAAMLAAGRRLRPLRTWGCYVPRLAQPAVHAADTTLLAASRDLHPGLVAALRIADFASPECYALPGEPVAQYRLRLMWQDSLLRPHQPAIIPGLSPWCAPTKGGPAGDTEADMPASMDCLSAGLSYAARVCGGRAVLWGGRHHAAKTNRPWNPDSHAWAWYVQKWLAGEVH